MTLPRLLPATSLLWAALVLANALGARALTIDLAPSRDNTLIETPVGSSNGAGDGIYAGRVGGLGTNTRRRALLAFDLSAIPPGSTIDAVTLVLQMTQSPDTIARTVALHRANADWGEAGSSGLGSGAPALPGDATWLYGFFSTIPWTTPGGDFAAVPSASRSVTANGSYAWTSAALIADVQSWADHAGTNFGWLVTGPEDTALTVKKFSSREGPVPARLTISFTPAGAGVGSGPVAAVSFAAPWPSPAAGPVSLAYTLPHAASVTLTIEDVTGRVVRRLADGAAEPAGRHVRVWDGRTRDGARAAPGVYMAGLVVDGSVHRQRILLLR